MSKNTERINAALAAISQKVETAQTERDALAARLARVQERLAAVKANKLYAALPSWLREKLEGIFDDE